MTIDLTKSTCYMKDNPEIETQEVQTKYLFGTYSQEEAIQLVRKMHKPNFEQPRSAEK